MEPDSSRGRFTIDGGNVSDSEVRARIAAFIERTLNRKS
jgi:hypothetical protein